MYLWPTIGKTAETLKPKVIFYTSTREVYGEILNKELSEKNKLKPNILWSIKVHG